MVLVRFVSCRQLFRLIGSRTVSKTGLALLLVLTAIIGSNKIASLRVAGRVSGTNSRKI